MNSNSSIRWFDRGIVCAGTALILSACGGEAGTDDDVRDEGGSTAAQEPLSHPEAGGLTARSNSTLWFRWSKGQPRKTLAPIDTHICGLSMVRGELVKNTTLRIFRSGGNWVMEGTNPGSNHLEMDATCEPLSAFRVNAGQIAAITGDFSASSSTDNANRVTSLPAHSAGVLTGLQGDFEGSDERARVTDLPSVQLNRGDQDGTHAAFATTLEFGLTLGQVPLLKIFPLKFVCETTGVPILPVGHHNCVFRYAQDPIAELSSHYCFLSSVRGDFDGAVEWIQVFPDFATNRWIFWLQAGSLDGIEGGVQCLPLNQVQNPPPQPR